MVTLVKTPTKVAEERDLSGTNEIYDIVSLNDYPDFVTFDEKYKIGMYVNDSGRLMMNGKNFVFNGHIIYGTVVFVGLNKINYIKKMEYYIYFWVVSQKNW